MQLCFIQYITNNMEFYNIKKQISIVLLHSENLLSTDNVTTHTTHRGQQRWRCFERIFKSDRMTSSCIFRVENVQKGA